MKIPHILIPLLLLSSCTIVKKITGTDIDPVRFEKAREAKMLEIRSEFAGKMAKKIIDRTFDKSDITISISQSFINQIVKEYIGSTGQLDQNTSFVINNITPTLNYGSAIISIELEAFNSSHNVTVFLAMDCILAFATDKNEINIRFEPFNIAPVAVTKGLLSSASEIIENLIKINLADLSKKFPPITLPINFKNNFEIKETNTKISDKINLAIKVPERKINYTVSINDIFIFTDNILIALNIDEISVK